MDAAALALNIDSSKVVTAANDLDRFAASAERAGKAGAALGGSGGSISKIAASAQSMNSTIAQAVAGVDKVSRASSAAATAQAGAATATNQHARSLATVPGAANQATASITRLTTVANDNARAMQANTGNIAAQFQDIGVTAAMGMNPLIIGLQQGTQLSAVFAQSGGSMGAVLAGAFRQIASAQALMTIGLVAAVAALIQMVDWAALAQSVLLGLADILPVVADAVVYLGAVMALAFAPQIISAILTVISTIGVGLVNAVVAATQAMIAFAVANPFGAFVIAVGLAGAAVWAFNDDISKVLGFNVLEMAKRGANFVIGSFVGAFHDIQFVWKNFPTIMGAAAIGAANMVIRSVNWIVEKSVGAINSLIDGANWALDKMGMGKIGHVTATKMGELANASANALTGAVSTRNSQLQKDLSYDYIGAIGGAIDRATVWAQGKLRGLAGGIGAAAGGKAGGGAAEGAASAARAAEANPSAPIVANPLWDLELPKLPDIRPIETAMSRIYDSMIAARQVTKGFLSDWINGIREGGNIFKSFADSVVSGLNRIIDRLLDRSLNMLVDMMFPTSGGGGLLGSLLGSIGLTGGGSSSSFAQDPYGRDLSRIGLPNDPFSVFSNALGGAYGTAHRYANGGAFTNSIVTAPSLFRFANGAKLGEMGEAGPEAIMPLKRGPNGSLGVEAHGGGGRSGNVNIENHYHVSGAIDQQSIVAMIRQGGEQTYNQVKRDFENLLRQIENDGAIAT